MDLWFAPQAVALPRGGTDASRSGRSRFAGAVLNARRAGFGRRVVRVARRDGAGQGERRQETVVGRGGVGARRARAARTRRNGRFARSASSVTRSSPRRAPWRGRRRSWISSWTRTPSTRWCDTRARVSPIATRWTRRDPRWWRKNSRRRKKQPTTAAAACPNSIILKTVFSQMCLDCPDEETDDLAAMMREVHALVNSKIAAANDPRAASESTNDGRRSAKFLFRRRRAPAGGVRGGFKEEFTACLELDKDVLSMIAFPRVNFKGMKSKTAPKAYDFLSGWIKDRFNRLETEKENYIRMARLNARGAGTSAGVADFSQAYVKYRDAQRKTRSRKTARANAPSSTRKRRSIAAGRSWRRCGAKKTNGERFSRIRTCPSHGRGRWRRYAASYGLTRRRPAEKASAASRLAEKPRPSNAAKVENPNAVPAARTVLEGAGGA